MDFAVTLAAVPWPAVAGVFSASPLRSAGRSLLDVEADVQVEWHVSTMFAVAFLWDVGDSFAETVG